MISALSILSRLVLWVLEDVKKPTLREFQEPLEVSGYITVQVQYIFLLMKEGIINLLVLLVEYSFEH